VVGKQFDLHLATDTVSANDLANSHVPFGRPHPG